MYARTPFINPTYKSLSIAKDMVEITGDTIAGGTRIFASKFQAWSQNPRWAVDDRSSLRRLDGGDWRRCKGAPSFVSTQWFKGGCSLV
jgi:hypothetical protein